MLTLITASKENYSGLKNIYDEIKTLGKDIFWIIKDTGECIKTNNFFSKLDDNFITFINTPDDGIYNALNICLENVKTEWYLTVGSDDILHSEKIAKLLVEMNNINENLDFMSLPVIIKGKLAYPKYAPENFSCRRLIVSHSVGLVIKTNLHKKFGKYSEKYNILSDSLFIDICIKNGAIIKFFPFSCVGEFMLNGISSTQVKNRIEEAYEYHLEIGYSQLIQKMYRILRLAKFIFLKQ
ncbi:MAG: glycosyltransferase [Amylibacter sp.]